MQKDFEAPTFYMILMGLFVGSLIMAGMHGAKLVEVGPFTFDGGLLIYACTFIITDIVSEIYGKRQAVKIVIAGFFAILASIVMTQFALFLPASPDWEIGQEYNTIFAIGSRVWLAVIVTYILSQAVDLTLFAWIKKKTNGKHLWLRNNISTVCGSVIDAVVFTTIAFYGVFPVGPIILAAIMVRIAFAAIDTPIVYAAVWFVNRKKTTAHNPKGVLTA